ncbi:2-phosphosulfolactate phosphatase [Streptomyces sp. NPDC004752]
MLTAFDPWPDAQLHLDWGLDAALLAAERGDAVVVVDALTFSTTAIMAVALGADVLALPRAVLEQEGDHTVIETRYNARLLANDPPDRQLRGALTELAGLRPGDRVVVPSQNGGTLCAAVEQAPGTAIGSFRNRTAVAQWCATSIANGTARRVTLIAAGSMWSQMTPFTALRPSIEDGLAAGAIASAARGLGLTVSVEAAAMAALFEAGTQQEVIGSWLRRSVTGRWLQSRGEPSQVEDACLIDHDTVVPVRCPDQFFRNP